MNVYILTISIVPFVMVYFFKLILLKETQSKWKWISLKEFAVLVLVCALSFIYLERYFQQYTSGKPFLYVFSSIFPWSVNFSLYIWLLIKIFQITKIKAHIKKKLRESNQN